MVYMATKTYLNNFVVSATPEDHKGYWRGHNLVFWERNGVLEGYHNEGRFQWNGDTPVGLRIIRPDYYSKGASTGTVIKQDAEQLTILTNAIRSSPHLSRPQQDEALGWINKAAMAWAIHHHQQVRSITA